MYEERLPQIKINYNAEEPYSKNTLTKSSSCILNNDPFINKYFKESVNNSIPLNERYTPSYNRTPGINAYKSYDRNKNLYEAESYLNYMNEKKNSKVFSPYKRYNSPFLNNSMATGRSINDTQNIYNNMMRNSNSFGGISTSEVRRSRVNEITKQDLYFKLHGDYQVYKEEQKKFLKYNYDLMQRQNLGKKYIDINPFNPLINENLGKSTLIHNTILNPLNNFTYNKYLESQLKKLGKINGEEKRNIINDNNYK
ncbi:MAG: hypothetical protein MJ252_21875 [archaeon]|nr:hypothetical protein [archaeon]